MDDLQYGRPWPLTVASKRVLNLIINGWPSIQILKKYIKNYVLWVLNLIINGWPSIL